MLFFDCVKSYLFYLDRSIHVQFGVGKATAFRAVRRITYALHCLAPRFIQWPKGETVRCTINEFSKIKNFPNVIGALDGSHIKIRAPKEDAASYICRKQFHAIHLQAVCNKKCVFTHCYAGHVDSVHEFLQILPLLITLRFQMNIFRLTLIL